MIITTTNSIEGRKVSAYKGLIMSDAILGANVFRDIFAGLRDFFGGRSGSYEKTLKEARRDAMAELEEKARALGADAIVGLSVDYEIIGEKGSMIMVCLTGTAVTLEG